MPEPPSAAEDVTDLLAERDPRERILFNGPVTVNSRRLCHTPRAPMTLSPGTRIAVFEVVSKLGEGGMGEVYRARDTRLDREVALKVLPALFSNDPDRMARFEREAKVLATLNHPNIAQVYGFEPPSAANGQAAIAMELVEGRDLSDVIAGAPGAEGPGLHLNDALAIAHQIATALEAAHELGIIHRDLKPPNVKVREDGTVKILDFGLAKAFAADADGVQSNVANSPTLTARSTQLGMILGTAAYMSPEQAKGRAVDRRADVWAFGVVLFEMLAGRRVFDGDDVSDVLASVLKSEPDWSLLPADLPPPVRRLLRRCLEKDPKKRLRDIAEGMLQLDEGLASGSQSSIMMPAGAPGPGETPAPPLPAWRRVLPLMATAMITAGVVTAITIWRTPPPPQPAATVRAQFQPAASMDVFLTSVHRDIAISADGRQIAYFGANPSAQIYIRQLDQLDAVPLRGADGLVSPFFSADGEWLGTLDAGDPTTIRKVAVLGGPQVEVATAPTAVRGAAWGPDGIVFGTEDGPLFHVPSDGGTPTALTTIDATNGMHIFPALVPGTPIVLFSVIDNTRPRGAVEGQLAALDRSTGTVVNLNLAGLHPRWAPSGHLVFATADGSLRAVRFDPASMTVIGSPVPVAEEIGVKSSGAANFDISDSGHLIAFALGNINAKRTIVSVDRSGRETPLAAPARNYFYVRASPDGTHLSLDARDEEEDIWIWDLKRDDLSRLTDTAGSDQYGLWTTTSELVFSSSANGRPELYRHRQDGVGQPVVLSNTAAERLVPFPNAVTPDNKHVIFRSVRPGAKNDLFILDMEGDKKSRALLSSEHDELNAAMSPDGKYMLFESDQTGGQREVFLRPFPDVNARQIKVSTNGGSEPVWSPRGREIFFIANDQVMVVPVTQTAGDVQVGKPVPLFSTKTYFFGGTGRNYDVTPDGQRFWMVKNPESAQTGARPLSIVLNWTQELLTRVK